ncbi:hypothetical protein GCM10011360_21480 [Primorskyibacter flagellatus]|uniref:Polysaccharide biosynthesis protein n=1 Tax=Primorskyibacter flagellatus TaxID=1387277 RepID=A0A917A7H0_9RHOB|nr:hypothetical protein [Primorskyibacter flagellatus]GGE33331.1 hypothetical protein GCM10011360_21480 [Primorskyibacter flagellatus]
MTRIRKFQIVALARVWNLAAGLGLVLVATLLFTPEQQGYFYTFLSLGAAQYFCDLGVGFVLGNIAGRRTAGDVHGDPFQPEALANMRQITRFALHWCLLTGAVLVIVLGILGWRVFHGIDTGHGPLVTIWYAYAVLAAYTMSLHMVLRIFEAVGFVVEAALARSIQSLINILALVALALLGWEMWAVVGALALALAGATAYFWLTSAKIRSAFGRAHAGGRPIHWRRDVLPFQSRVAASFIGSYGIFQAQVPLLFLYAGPVAAGQFGLMMQIFQAINTSANIFLTFSIKSWTALAVASDWRGLLFSFRRVLAASTALTAVAALLVIAMVAGLAYWDLPIAERFPSLPLVALYALAACANQVYFAWGYLFRTREEEPFWLLSLVLAAMILLVPLILQESYTLTIATLAFTAASVLGMCAAASLYAVSLIRKWA